MRSTDRGTFIARGQTTQIDGPVKLNIFDGTYKKGFRIVKFEVSGSATNANNDCSGKLTTEEVLSTGDVWNWDDNREIAWASTNMFATGIREPVASFIDSSIVVVEDLFVYVTSITSTSFLVNYMIELEPVMLREWEYGLNYVQNNSQG
jgi:hypothetical protein